MAKAELQVSSQVAPLSSPMSLHRTCIPPAALTKESCWSLPFSPPLQSVHQQVLPVLSLGPHCHPSNTVLTGLLAVILYHCSQSVLDIVAELSCKTKSGPGQVVQLVRASSNSTKVVGSISSPGTYKKQPMNISNSGATNQ